MNIVIYNGAKKLIESLEIDIIKSIPGIFSVTELKEMVGSMYYERLLLDVTSIKDYKSTMVMQNLANTFDMSKVVLILEDDAEGVQPGFISNMISLGIYNFTRNKEGLIYLIKNINTYNDVAHLHQTNQLTDQQEAKVKIQQKVIGFINVTEHAGASSLIYMLLKNIAHLEKSVGIEINKYDFKYFRNPNMVSVTQDALNELITTKYSDCSVILLDLNDYAQCSLATDIVYLIEPSVIRMNKLTASSKNFMVDLKFKKLVLNMSNISSEAILDFQQETGLNILANVKSVNDRDDHHDDVANLAEKLGLVTNGGSTKKGIFNL